MNEIAGLGKTERKRLTEVLRGTKGTISVAEVAEILNISQKNAAKILSLWAKKGWLSRIRRGMYIPVGLESRTASVPLDDPWIVATRLFSPCYIGGWSAAEYWDFTEQIFRTILIITTQNPRKRSVVINGSNFILRSTKSKAMFGLKSVWRGVILVSVSDPSRTILDLLDDPRLGGGIRPSVDILLNYLKSKEKNLAVLTKYTRQLGNGAVFKRLGFLLEFFAPGEKETIANCQASLTEGNAELDPALDKYELSTRWKLWLPRSWKQHL